MFREALASPTLFAYPLCLLSESPCLRRLLPCSTNTLPTMWRG